MSFGDVASKEMPYLVGKDTSNLFCGFTTCYTSSVDEDPPATYTGPCIGIWLISYLGQRLRNPIMRNMLTEVVENVNLEVHVFYQS